MASDVLALARDWAVLLLALEISILALVPLFVLYHVTRWLRRFIPKVAPALRNVCQKMRTIADTVKRVMKWVSAPFIWANSIVAGTRAILVGLRRVSFKGR